MKLLFITQKIDKDDDILGVYHEWAREISKSFDKLSVICLYEGRNELPESIKVFSLGKEGLKIKNLKLKISAKLKYIYNFLKYIWLNRDDYDAALVHMNPVYVLLGWPIWKIMGKEVCLWYAHPSRNWQVRLAYVLCDKIVTSVPEAFYKKTGKVFSIGQGIDTEFFSARGGSALGGKNTSINTSIKSSILCLGRISPSKNIHVLVEALRVLRERGVSFSFNLVGSPPEMSGAAEYDKKIKGMIIDYDMADILELHGSVPYSKTVNWYNRSEIFVNLSPVGHFDKTVLEAMASGCITLASNDAYYGVFPKELHEYLIFRHGDADDLAQKLQKVLELPEIKKDEIRKRLRGIVVRDHAIYTLGERIRKVLE